MEKLNFVRNGVIRLPPGFRFHPTDEELVLQYLRRKVFSCPLPASIIPEVDVCKYEPWDLPGDLEQERYFFSTRENKYKNGTRPNRATTSGYWKATGLDKKIVASKTYQNQVVGMKKTLVFYRGKPSNAIKTDWIMHEYRLSDAAKSKAEMEDWVICRIFLKKRGTKIGGDDNVNSINIPSYNKKEGLDLTLGRPGFIDFMKHDMEVATSTTNSSSSPASSGITEVSSTADEFSSCCNSISS